MRETLLPLLLLPVVAPVLIGATRAFEAALGTVGVDGWAWVGLLAVFAVVYIALGSSLSAPCWRTRERPRRGRTELGRRPASSASLGSPRSCCAATVLFGLVLSPGDVEQGDAVRLIYVHVPTAIARLPRRSASPPLGSVLYLVEALGRGGTSSPRASAEIGVLFTGLTLVTGSLWGRPTWGSTGTGTPASPPRRCCSCSPRLPRRPPAPGRPRRAQPTRSAIVGLVGVVDVPIVHYAVDWWRSLHQGATIATLDPKIEGLDAVHAASSAFVAVRRSSTPGC